MLQRCSRHYALALFSILASASFNAQATTASELAAWCADRADDFQYGMCLGFINGALAGIGTERENVRAEVPSASAYRPVERICIPKDSVTQGRLRELIIKCVAKDPNDGRTDGGDLVYFCVHAVFSCANDGPAQAP